MTYSKSSKRERKDLFKIQQESEDFFKIQQERASEIHIYTTYTYTLSHTVRDYVH